MMFLYIQFTDSGQIERVQVTDKERGVAVEHRADEPTTADAEMATVVGWALGKLADGRATLLRDTLARIGGIAPDKLDAAVAAIDKVKTEAPK